jgi:hypothetical protein
MNRPSDHQSGEEFEPLDEHATYRLGIDYGLRSAFAPDKPLARQEYDSMWRFGLAGAYFGPPPYEEYLRLWDMYSRTCRLRATGLGGTDAAEAVRKRSLPDLLPLDKAAFMRLAVRDELRGAFTQGRPLSQEEYEAVYVFEPVLPDGVVPYEDYVRNWHYYRGEAPPSVEEYTKIHYFVAPPYGDYLKLYEEYSEGSS